jgi:tRNA (guanine-N7-)-methyltransferase
MDERHLHLDLRSYGRRRGRKPSSRQASLLDKLLPDVGLSLSDAAPASLGTLFSPVVREVWLEIGFGGGEHLLWQAMQNPAVGFIGCEPFQDGVVKVLRAIEERKLANIRLHADDARAVLRWLPEASIARAFVLFPDPWPKKRHRKRRLVSAGALRELARTMGRGGQLRIATDIGDYARWMLQAVCAEASFKWEPKDPSDWRQRPADWPATRYEQKALKEGRRCTYLTLLRQ